MATKSSPSTLLPLSLQQQQSNAIRQSIVAHHAKYAYSTSISQMIPAASSSSSSSVVIAEDESAVLNISSSTFVDDPELRRMLGPTFVPSTYVNKVMFRHSLSTTMEPLRETKK